VITNHQFYTNRDCTSEEDIFGLGEYFFINKGSLNKYGGTAVDVFAFAIE